MLSTHQMEGCSQWCKLQFQLDMASKAMKGGCSPSTAWPPAQACARVPLAASGLLSVRWQRCSPSPTAAFSPWASCFGLGLFLSSLKFLHKTTLTCSPTASFGPRLSLLLVRRNIAGKVAAWRRASLSTAVRKAAANCINKACAHSQQFPFFCTNWQGLTLSYLVQR